MGYSDGNITDHNTDRCVCVCAVKALLIRFIREENAHNSHSFYIPEKQSPLRFSWCPEIVSQV